MAAQSFSTMSPTLGPMDDLIRVRLSDWARSQGISRITAYRMLQRGLLPVPSERSPTGRWYVLVAPKRIGRTAIYARAEPGPAQVDDLNEQIVALSEWAAQNRRRVFTVVREVASLHRSSMPRLEMLLADQQIVDIIIADPEVIGRSQIQLLSAALASQGRSISVATLLRSSPDKSDDEESDEIEEVLDS